MEIVYCLGSCGLAPVAVVDDKVLRPADAEQSGRAAGNAGVKRSARLEVDRAPREARMTCSNWPSTFWTSCRIRSRPGATQVDLTIRRGRAGRPADHHGGGQRPRDGRSRPSRRVLEPILHHPDNPPRGVGFAALCGGSGDSRRRLDDSRRSRASARRSRRRSSSATRTGSRSATWRAHCWRFCCPSGRRSCATRTAVHQGTVRHGDERTFAFDTAAIRAELEDVPLSHPVVAQWLAEFLAEGEA